MAEMPEAAAKGTASASSRSVSHMERSRREKMTEFYAALHSIVPNLFPKATRTRVIDETIAYIKGLEDAVARLEEAKASASAGEASNAATAAAAARVVRSGSGSGAAEVTVSAPGSTAFFGVRFGGRGAGAVTRVLEVFERHGAEVLAAAVACDGGGGVNVTVTAAVGEGDVLQKIKEELMNL